MTLQSEHFLYLVHLVDDCVFINKHIIGAMSAVNACIAGKSMAGSKKLHVYPKGFLNR